MKINYILALLLIALTSSLARAQYFPLSETAEVSILTMGPGAHLYDKFGHSAFRVYDESQGIDLVYNYGVYDFNTPNFYLKFAQGKLLYKLAVSPYTPFIESYIAENRWVKEQILDLSYTEKQNVFNYLENNAKPENKYYKYDFFFDNCATKIRDVLVSVLGEKLMYDSNYTEEAYTFRELIQKNVHWNSWGSLGMDVAIGAVVDKKASLWDYQFLPNYVFEGAANATLTRSSENKPLIKETKTIFTNAPSKETSFFFYSPLFVFGILGFVILIITYNDLKKNKRNRFLDASIFFITGIIGILLLLLWVATDHSTTVMNYNLLWAFPVSIFFTKAIVSKTPKKWIKRYVFFIILLLCLVVIHWISGVQEFSYGFIPLFIALLVRYLYLFRFLKNN